MDPMKIAAMADEAARALRAGDAQTAAGLYKTLVAHQPQTTNHWVNLAQAEARRGNPDAALAALDEALAIEPRLLPALLLKAVNLEERGDVHGAGDIYQAALTVAPPFDQVPRELRPLIQRGQGALGRLQSARNIFFRDRLAEIYRGLAGAKADRFAQSVDVLLGKKSIYRQQPHNFYFPGLPEAQFYDRDDFDWLKGVEASTDLLRAEFEAVWRDDHGFSPYVEYPPGAPVDQWAELNHSLRWSVFHILRSGAEVAGNADRCPNTLAAVQAAPSPELANRSPNAMFSLLQPHTRIPPHMGETNVRLVVHIPLIVPQQTGFRVGNDTRPWRVGEAFVFNDTIEHEAWNDSDQIRVVLIFDIWHPGLSMDERQLVARLMTLRDEFRGQSGPGLGL